MPTYSHTHKTCSSRLRPAKSDSVLALCCIFQMAHTDGLNPLSRMLYYVTSDLPPPPKNSSYILNTFYEQTHRVCVHCGYLCHYKRHLSVVDVGNRVSTNKKKGLYSAFERHKTLFFFLRGESWFFIIYVARRQPIVK
jgi:hypothetical protein